ncbi:MAG: ribosome biogenesis GTP-binding protein YsxC [Acidimicrobiia bacterium]|nr:ribosome biogenesis GTP-binding protein YsxC [Acidimicrobiia bacterium]
MAGPLRFEFVRSVADLSDLPDTDVEVAVLGRSNVGKSSLINALAGRRNLAQTSKTPGRTRLLNVYRLGDRATMVDCPGYGFARASGSARADWMDLVAEYLLQREELAMVMILSDGVVGPTDLDLDMLSWLREEGIPHTVVATKMDKVKASNRVRRRRDLAQKSLLGEGDVMWTSTTNNSGIEGLRGLIRLWLEA